MIKTEYFDPQRAMDLATRIAFPRRSHSDAERLVGDQLSELLRRWGYAVERQEFVLADALPAFVKGEVLVGQFLISATAWLSTLDSPLALFSAVSLALWIGLTGWINQSVLQRSVEPTAVNAPPLSDRIISRLGGRHRSANYFASLAKCEQSRQVPPKPVLILVAHYDSKSQRMPIPVRIALVTLAMWGGLLLSVLVFLAPLYPALADLILPTSLFSILAGIPLLFLGEGNRSPGAIDNASGVGLVLHLAEIYAARPEMQEKLDLRVLLTGAEESGCLGASAFVRQYANWMRRMADRGELHILNIDGIGVDGTVRWVGRRGKMRDHLGLSLFDRVGRSAQAMNIPLRGFSLPGALYDHIPFARAGFDAGTIICTGWDSLAVHTPGDAVQRLSVNGFCKAGEVVLGLIASRPAAGLEAKTASAEREKPKVPQGRGLG